MTEKSMSNSLDLTDYLSLQLDALIGQCSPPSREEPQCKQEIVSEESLPSTPKKKKHKKKSDSAEDSPSGSQTTKQWKRHRSLPVVLENGREIFPVQENSELVASEKVDSEKHNKKKRKHKSMEPTIAVESPLKIEKKKRKGTNANEDIVSTDDSQRSQKMHEKSHKRHYKLQKLESDEHQIKGEWEISHSQQIPTGTGAAFPVPSILKKKHKHKTNPQFDIHQALKNMAVKTEEFQQDQKQSYDKEIQLADLTRHRMNEKHTECQTESEEIPEHECIMAIPRKKKNNLTKVTMNLEKKNNATDEAKQDLETHGMVKENVETKKRKHKKQPDEFGSNLENLAACDTSLSNAEEVQTPRKKQRLKTKLEEHHTETQDMEGTAKVPKPSKHQNKKDDYHTHDIQIESNINRLENSLENQNQDTNVQKKVKQNKKHITAGKNQVVGTHQVVEQKVRKRERKNKQHGTTETDGFSSNLEDHQSCETSFSNNEEVQSPRKKKKRKSMSQEYRTETQDSGLNHKNKKEEPATYEVPIESDINEFENQAIEIQKNTKTKTKHKKHDIVESDESNDTETEEKVSAPKPSKHGNNEGQPERQENPAESNISELSTDKDLKVSPQMENLKQSLLDILTQHDLDSESKRLDNRGVKEELLDNLTEQLSIDENTSGISTRKQSIRISDLDYDIQNGVDAEVLGLAAQCRLSLSDQQAKMLKELKVKLPYSIPPLHKIETRISGRPSKDQRGQMEMLGIQVKWGNFTLEEDRKLKENWNHFCEIHDIPPNPRPFFFTNHGSGQSAFPRKNRLRFVRFLAHGLDDRPLCSVFMRFKRLFDVVNTGRFTEKEDKMIVEYLSSSTTPRPFRVLATILNRDVQAVEKRFKVLAKGEPRIAWDEENLRKLLEVVLKVTRCEDPSELENREISLKEWKKIGKKLGGCGSTKVRRQYLRRLYPRLFMPDDVDTKEIKERLINLLIENGEDDYRALKWKEIATNFTGFTSAYLHSMFSNMIYSYVPESKKGNLRETLQFLKTRIVDGGILKRKKKETRIE